MSCSESPSEKYSWSFAGLMSTKGSTAIELAFNKERVALLRANQKWSAVAATATTVRMGMIANFRRYWVREDFSFSEEAVPGTTSFCVPSSGGGVALSSLTGAINWYPRLEKVSIYVGFSGS